MQDENFHCKPDSTTPKTICKPYGDQAKEIWQASPPIETKDEIFDGFNSFPVNYEPEMLTIKKDLIYKLLPALEFGLESTQQVLCEHDASLGRDWTKNRIWAETLEQEIRDMQDCIKQLKILDISKSTHYP